MTVRLRLDQCCIREGCNAPIRELGNLCSAHWRSLTATKRRTLIWESEQPTEPLDSRAIAERLLLEGWMNAPAYGEAA